MPTYYIRDLNMNMAETVELHRPSDREVSQNTWLPDAALEVYTEEYGRTGLRRTQRISHGIKWNRKSSSSSYTRVKR